MTQIDNKFKVKKGLEVVGETLLGGNTTVTGDLNIPTQLQTDNSTKAATTAFVKTAVADLLNAAPGTLDTLNELAAALGNDPNFASTMTTNLALKAPLDSPALTGVPTVPTAATATNTTQAASTAYVKAQFVSPLLSGVPTAPTAATDTGTSQLATTLFVMNQAASVAPLMNSVAAIGTSKRYARQDHVHASDTSKASLAGATFTGGINTRDITVNGAYVIQNNTDHLYLQSVAVSKDVVIRTSSNVERVRVRSDTGAVLINTAADNGVDQLQVAGTIAATIFKGGAELSGAPTAPTASPGTNNTQLATTAFAVAADALKANAANPSFTGDATFAGAIASNDYISIPLPDGARYITTTALITGAFKITLPVLYSDSMVNFTVRFHEHSTGKTFELVAGGYLNGTSTTWQNVTAFVAGESVGKIPNIRFGNDGSRSCIWVGDTTTTWDYPQVTVRDVSVGFVGLSSSWLNPWAVDPVTTFDTIKVGPIVPTKFAGLVSPALTGVPTAPTAAALNNSTQIATTAYVDTANTLKAPLASPALTGVPTAPTATAGTSTTQVATTAFVGTAVANLIASSPAALDTLNELAAALGNDPAFATTITNAVSMKAPLANPALTGVPTAPTAAVDTSTTQLATTAFVANQGYAKIVGSGFAPLASPVFTGDPTAPTPTLGDSDNSIATTGFVNNTTNSFLSKSVAGGVTVNLTAVEAKNRVIALTGLLTANISVIIPTMTGIWAITNSTTGAFTVTVKLASGTGVTVAQGGKDILISDNANVYSAKTDFTNVGLAGIPTATTASAADNTARIATTAFVKSQGYIATADTIDGGSY